MAKSQKKKKKKRVQKFKRTVVLLLVLMLALSCFCLFAPFFNITDVEVHGNAQVTSQEILDRTSIAVGTNIFKLSKKSVREGLKTLAYLDTIKVSRKLPSTVKITVTECYSELLFPYTTGYLATNSKGKILEIITDPVGWDLPQVFGVEIELAEISEKIAVQDGVKFDIILECIQYFKELNQLEKIAAFDFTDITNIWVTYREGYRVNFAKLEDMEYKMKMLETILPQVDRSAGTYIDLTTPSKVFTGKTEATPEPEVQDAEASAAPEESEQKEPKEGQSTAEPKTVKDPEAEPSSTPSAAEA